ncbi:hypothetical protein Dalk_2673 [Desulfatibacillum aliphaticivorans]|uniref:Uncharacterized protein n=1 Tax=Desulfatibacillum aliphaticivorans TaxID=218208 RepID=B8FIX4_DESAL|nr:hypothetical protein [Desulfatibacillum aliphaticivorans]ACL04365.1 hypothetical protein Dalk_2673 [Desulfatibacillum aliphaticivorans]
MDLFITIFNANRHWILPIILMVVAGFVAREVRNFLLESGVGDAGREFGLAVKNARPMTSRPFSSKGISPLPPAKRARASLQFGGAMLFHNDRFNGMK